MRKSSVVRLFAAVFALGALFTAYTQFGNQPSKLNTIKLKDDLYAVSYTHLDVYKRQLMEGYTRAARTWFGHRIQFF